MTSPALQADGGLGHYQSDMLSGSLNDEFPMARVKIKLREPPAKPGNSTILQIIKYKIPKCLCAPQNHPAKQQLISSGTQIHPIHRIATFSSHAINPHVLQPGRNHSARHLNLILNIRLSLLIQPVLLARHSKVGHGQLPRDKALLEPRVPVDLLCSHRQPRRR